MIVSSTSANIFIQEANNESENGQTVRLIFPGITKLVSTIENLYLGTNDNGSGGSKVATINELEETFVLKDDAVINNSISLGRNTNSTIGYYSTAIGLGTQATQDSSYAEGSYTTASGAYAHAEGESTEASGSISHAEGYHTIASGNTSHVEGYYTEAAGRYSHVTGKYNAIETKLSVPYWRTNTQYKVGDLVRYSGSQSGQAPVYICIYDHVSTTAQGTLSNVFWRETDLFYFAEIIGNGTSEANRSNARALDWNGNEHLKGDIYVGCNADSSGGTKLARIPDPPSTDGTYTLQATVSSGTITYTWVAST